MTKHHPPLIIYTAFVIFIATACHDDNEGATSSERVSTNETYITIDITARASGRVSGRAAMKEGGAAGDTINLVGKDGLWFSQRPITDYETSEDILASLVEAKGNVDRMREQGTVEFDFFWTDYYEDLSGAYYTGAIRQADNDRYYVGYLRDDYDTNAVDSYAILPPAFEITAPLNNETVSRTNDLVVNWETGGSVDETEISVELVCNDRTRDKYRETVTGDPGTFTIPGGSLDTSAGSCPLSIEITKQVAGTLDPAYNSGQVTGRRVDTVTVSSVD